MKYSKPNLANKLVILGFGLAYVVWASVFIYKSSFIAIDGERHFSLFDDAMISMRYAWNLSHGLGLVWNPGERVEGFTNMLLVLYMSLFTGILSKGGAVLAVQVSGIVFMLSTAFFTMKIGGLLLARTGRDGAGSLDWLFFLAGLLYYPLSYWSLMGMDTGLLTALLLAAVWVALRADDDVRFVPALPLLLGLAFWTRPDAAVPGAIIMGYRLLRLRRASASAWKRTLLREICIIALFAASITLFRLVYYGSPLPNTYTLKMTGFPLYHRLISGWGFLKLYLVDAWPVLVLIGAAVAYRPHRRAVLLLVLILASLFYQVYVGGDPWIYWRMMAPYMPLVFVLLVGVAFEIRGSLARFGRIASLALVVVASALCLGGALLLNWDFRREATFELPPYNTEFNHAAVSAALAIEAVTTEDASVGVVWAGGLPYYSGRKAIDFLGRTDANVASLQADCSGTIAWRGMKSVPGHNKYDLEYSIVELKPTYVQRAKWGKDNVLPFLKREYKAGWYKGVPLTLKKNSPYVKWQEVESTPPKGLSRTVKDMIRTTEKRYER